MIYPIMCLESNRKSGTLSRKKGHASARNITSGPIKPKKSLCSPATWPRPVAAHTGRRWRLHGESEHAECGGLYQQNHSESVSLPCWPKRGPMGKNSKSTLSKTSRQIFATFYRTCPPWMSTEWHNPRSALKIRGGVMMQQIHVYG